MFPLYTAVTVYAMDAIGSAVFSCPSPFKLVLLCRPSDILNLSFPPLQQFLNLHKDYLQLLKERADL